MCRLSRNSGSRRGYLCVFRVTFTFTYRLHIPQAIAPPRQNSSLRSPLHPNTICHICTLHLFSLSTFFCFLIVTFRSQFSPVTSQPPPAPFRPFSKTSVTSSCVCACVSVVCPCSHGNSAMSWHSPCVYNALFISTPCHLSRHCNTPHVQHTRILEASGLLGYGAVSMCDSYLTFWAAFCLHLQGTRRQAMYV